VPFQLGRADRVQWPPSENVAPVCELSADAKNVGFVSTLGAGVVQHQLDGRGGHANALRLGSRSLLARCASGVGAAQVAKPDLILDVRLGVPVEQPPLSQCSAFAWNS
jgi:hypothetical protein